MKKDTEELFPDKTLQEPAKVTLQEPAKVKRKTGPKKKINETVSKEIVRMVTNGTTEMDMSKVLGIPRSTIHDEIERLRKDKSFLLYKEKKGDVLEALEYRFLECITDEDIKSMIQRRGMVDFAITADKCRLARGESTVISSWDIRSLGIMVNLEGDAKSLAGAPKATNYSDDVIDINSGEGQ